MKYLYPAVKYRTCTRRRSIPVNKNRIRKLTNLRISIHINKICLQNYTIQIQNTQLPICGTRFTKNNNKYFIYSDTIPKYKHSGIVT